MRLNLLLFLFIFLFCWSCKVPKKAFLTASQGEIYQISKIDSIDNVYLVYAMRNDSTFKVISKKEQNIQCTQVRIGSNYSLSLESWFLPEEFYVKNRITGVKFENVLITVERDSVVGDIFITKNLKGLCYIP